MKNDKQIPLEELSNCWLNRKLTAKEIRSVKWWVETILELPTGTEKNIAMVRSIILTGGVTNLHDAFIHYAGDIAWEQKTRNLRNILR